MALTMKEKKAVTKELARRYKRAGKKEKTAMLTEFIVLTGYNRSYAARVLRQAGKAPPPKGVRRRKGRVTYTPEVVTALRKIWAILDGICSKRLAPYLEEIVPILEKSDEIKVDVETRQKLTQISAATIDRLLAPDRKKMTLKGRSQTKPGTLLKHQIPVRTFAGWDDDRPGFVEIDLVEHGGGSTRGDYCQTLDVTDVASGWTELAAVKNKAQKWVHEALDDIVRRLPFSVLGIDSDNGSEFINEHLRRYCEKREITFTRSRPGRKNDSCYVEEKNWSVVRRAVGYRRYDTDSELKALNELYRQVNDFTNFFLPSMRLVEKTREGAKVRRRHDRARTPYRRLIESGVLSKKQQKALAARYQSLNPAKLRRTINRLQDQLLQAHLGKSEGKEAATTPQLEYIIDEATKEPLEYIST